MRIIPSSLLGIRQDFVGRGDFCEARCSSFDIAIIAIGMELESFSSVCLFDSREGLVLVHMLVEGYLLVVGSTALNS